ncbi:MAG: TIGR01906 family membrane protein [Erysipelothrix sp.]|nr:TIGR01906 family membrane protein [Erysipelothrix sp.]
MKRLLMLGVIALFVANLTTAISLGALNQNFYVRFFDQHDLSAELNMSSNDLARSMADLLDYVIDKKTDLDILVHVDKQPVQMFNQREVDHMVDVKNLYRGLVYVQAGGYLVFMIIAISAWFKFKKTFVSELFAASKQALVLIAVIMVGIGFYAFVDFNSFWTSFHHVFFTNDLWLLDPTTDRMIMMMPLALFQKLVIHIILYWLASLVIYFLLIKTLLFRGKL